MTWVPSGFTNGLPEVPSNEITSSFMVNKNMLSIYCKLAKQFNGVMFPNPLKARIVVKSSKLVAWGGVSKDYMINDD